MMDAKTAGKKVVLMAAKTVAMMAVLMAEM